MDNIQTTFAKLAGALKAVTMLLEQSKAGNRPTQNFAASDVATYFHTTSKQVDILRLELPELYGDFYEMQLEPQIEMAAGSGQPKRFGRPQLNTLARYIEQIFELRANSELGVPIASKPTCVFISHGSATDWKDVQAYIEKDLKIQTLELAQQPNKGRTVLQKLEDESANCSFAVIVMTGDDTDSEGASRVRENVMHEIGYFQGRYDLTAVCLLHEEGTNIPSNIHGLVYIPFPKGYINAAFSTLMRELNAFLC